MFNLFEQLICTSEILQPMSISDVFLFCCRGKKNIHNLKIVCVGICHYMYI